MVYYNPRCVGSFNEDGYGAGGVYIANKICANFVYDLNGNKGPNTVGKDIGFITAMYPSDVKISAPVPAVNPLTGTYPYKASSSSISAAKACTNFDAEYFWHSTGGGTIDDDWYTVATKVWCIKR